MNHHACLLRQIKRDIGAALTQYSPDVDTEVVTLEYTILTISDVRALIATASRRPVALKSILLVVCFETIHSEAEQALLKILEEPPLTTKFLLLVPNSYRPLPTISSRVYELPSKEVLVVSDTSTFTMFMECSYKDRLELIASHCGEKKNLVWQSQMKVGLAEYVSKISSMIPLPSLIICTMILGQLDSRGSSTKMLLEELALTLPRT